MFMVQSLEVIQKDFVMLQGLSELNPMRARKNDRLRILDGPDAGSEGTLSSINGHEAVVKLQGGDEIVIVSLSSTGRLQ